MNQFAIKLKTFLAETSIDRTLSQSVYWRIMVPGHENCGKCITPGSADNKIYDWHLFAEQTREMINILCAVLPQLRIIDAEMLSRKRRDRHNSAKDCIHYCLPGPVDWWNQALLYELLL